MEVNGAGNNKMENGQVIKKTTVNKDTDGGWAWVVFAGTVLNTMIYFGQLTAGPIYYVVFLEEFGTSKSYTAWILAAQSAAFCAAGPLTSYLLSKISPRSVIISGSILYCICVCLSSFANSIPYLILTYTISGIACSLVHTADVAAITTYFQKKAYGVLGFMFAGAGLGGMLFALEVEWAIEYYGWRGAMLFQAAIVLNMCVGGALVFKKHPSKSAAESDATNDKKSNFKLVLTYLSDVRLWLIIVSLLMMNLALTTMVPLMKNIVIYNGLLDGFTYVVIAYGIGGFIGRGFIGLFTQALCPPITAMIVSFLGAVANIFYIWAYEIWIMVIVVFSFSLFLGACTVVALLQIGWVYGPKNMASISGYTLIFCLITTFAGAPVAGYTVDVTGDFTVAIIICSASSLIGACASLFLYVVHNRHLKRNKSDH